MALFGNRFTADVIKWIWTHTWVRWTPNPVWLVSFEKGKIRTQTRPQKCDNWGDAAGTTRSQEAVPSEGARPWGHLVLDCSSQNYETIKFYCSKPPGVWLFVVAALGDWDTFFVLGELLPTVLCLVQLSPLLETSDIPTLSHCWIRSPFCLFLHIF